VGVLGVLFRVVWEQQKRAVVGFLLLTQAAVPIPSWFIGPAVLKHVSDGGKRAVLEAPPVLVAKRVVLLNSGEIGAALYGPMYLHRAGRPMPQRWWALTLDPHPHRLTRVGAQSIELEVLGGRMLDAWYERLVRAEKLGFREGDRVHLAGADITVAKADGGKPVKLRVDFERPMEEHALVQWKDGQLVEVPPPEVGAFVDVEGVPSPLELQL
jgi:hypothetical protein